jgi:UDP-3-O-[3-hydroxymyristoyl] glucosamine N-acyltransferase
MTILIVFLLFLLLLILPFLPGIIELVRKDDAEPLFIHMDYAKDPRYFGKSFKHILRQAAAGLTVGPEIRDLQLSKQEKVQITESLVVSANREIDHVLYIQGNLITGDHAYLIKGAYATGDVSLGVNNTIHVLVADGNISVASGTKFGRWLDADGTIAVGENCNLGICASSGDKLYLDQNCIFRRLFGMPIITGNTQATAVSVLPKAVFLPLTPAFVRKKDREIPAGTVIDKHIVFTRDVNIGRDAILMGDVKSYGNVVIEENVTIHGNVFADGDIYIGSGAKIDGNVFSQKAVYIAKQVVISRPDVIKSVVGKKMVSIEQNVTIHGYVTTEGDGITA